MSRRDGASVQNCEGLSETERNALRLKAEGRKNRQIAEQLGYTQSTIDKMLSNSGDQRAIYPKIGVTTTAQAIVWYLSHCTPGNAKPQLTGDTDSPGAETPAVGSPQIASASADRPLPVAYIAAFTMMSICLVFLIFVPSLARGGDVIDEILLNLYALIPAVAGVYGIGHFNAPSTFLKVFKLFSFGLISWAFGGVIWTVYDLLIGLKPHYPSWSDLGYFTQTVVQVVSFGWWWTIVSRRSRTNWFFWLPIAIALIVPYYLASTIVKQMSQAQAPELIRLSLDLLNIVGDSLGAAFAICLILPFSLQLYTQRTRLAIYFISGGMLAFFFTGVAYILSLSVPDSHMLYYPAGGWIDAAFGLVMMVWGLGIAIAASAHRAFQDEVHSS